MHSRGALAPVRYVPSVVEHRQGAKLEGTDVSEFLKAEGRVLKGSGEEKRMCSGCV